VSEPITCFKAYDVRGRLPDQLNEEIAYRIGRAFADYLKAKTVAVGRDVRLSSPSIQDALVRGLNAQGADAYDIGLCGTEEIYFATADRGFDGGVMVTASHNPADYNGMKFVRQEARPLTGDTGLPEHRRNGALEMGDGMALFCSGLAGQFFDRPGKPWPAADVTILEMGMLAREGYEDQLTVAYISMMSHINDLVERHQSDARPTLVVTDEGHIITTNPLLARYVVKITKMWRKLGAWFWIATQNLEDFPDASRKMLNMMEWWLCLVMPKEEVEQIARFKDLNEEQRSLLLSARKEPGKYVEGVVLADNLEALFRSVPPPLSLALAMTEKHEKAERAEIMRERACTELEAVHIVAERIAARRGG
jgi:hypothetical protein